MRATDYARPARYVLLAIAAAPAVSALAAIEIVNDPALPPSADGFNITRDTENQLEWLDVDVSVGRSFEDLTGADGSNEFAPGGDFEGFRYATRLELTGANNGPQRPSLYRSLDISPFGFSSIGGYAPARTLITIAGCFGSCSSHGYTSGSLLDMDRVTPTVASMEAYTSQGFNWGRSATNGPPILLPPNDGALEQRGNWLVRPVAGSDSDGDLIPDVGDNCTLIDNFAQVDTDNDGHGNRCDADLNNDCVVNVSDLGTMRAVFFSSFANADLNVDGVVNFVDLGILRAMFFSAPGPSANGDCSP